MGQGRTTIQAFKRTLASGALPIGLNLNSCGELVGTPSVQGMQSVSSKYLLNLFSTKSARCAAAMSVIKVSWFSVQIEAEAIRTNQHAECVRG
jgi:hypothetical protein